MEQPYAPCSESTGRPATALTGTLYAAGMLALAGAVSSSGNLAFNVLIARIGGARTYGGIGALLGLATVGGFLSTGLQFAVARRVALGASGPRVIRDSLPSLLRWLTLPAALLAASVPIAGFLHLESAEPAMLAVLLLATMLISTLPTGVALGEERFLLIAVVTVAMVGVRLLVGMVLIAHSDPTVASLLATVIPLGLGASVVTLVVVRRPAHEHGHDVSLKAQQGMVADGSVGAMLSAGLWAIWTLPLFLARHYLGAVVAGDVAACALLSSAIPFATGAVIMAFFPSVVRDQGNRTVMFGMLVTTILAIAGILVLWLAGPYAIARVYGAGFAASTTLLVLFGVVGAVLAVASYLLWVARARRRFTAELILFIAVGLVVECVAIVGLHTTPNQILVGPLAGFAAGALAALLSTWLRAAFTFSRPRRFRLREAER